MYKINRERIVFTEMNEKGILFDIQKNEYKMLNETSLMIFRGLWEGLSSLQIRDLLIQEYTVSPGECLLYVNRLLEDLIKWQYITIEENRHL